MKKNNLFLVVLSLTCLLTACGKSSAGGNVEEKLPDITGVENMDEDRYIEGGLHKIDVKPSTNVLVKNPNKFGASSDYKIIYDTTSAFKEQALKAASFLSGNILEATGVELQVLANDGTFKCRSDSKYIYVGCKTLFQEAGLEMPSDDIGSSGYYITTKDLSCFLEVDRIGGFQMGAIAFSREVLGYDYYTDDFVTYDIGEGDLYLPEMEIVERPDFDCRNYVNNGSKARLYALGYTLTGIFIPVGNVAMHNCDKWLPFDDFGTKHRGWFQDVKSSIGYQLCYTAHGNKAEYDAMIEECFNVMENAYLSNPGVENITLTQLDVATCCECNTCKAVVNKDGSISATIIRFMNDLDNRFRESYADANLNLLFFAYHTSLYAPTTSVEEDPTLKCNEHVFPIVAPIEAKYNQSFYEEENASFAKNFEDWSKFCDKFCAWVYECNYHHYMYPYNSYQAMMGTYQFLKQYNTSIMYNEGQRYNTAVPCFGRFKDYIDSKLNVDVNVRYNDLKSNYFGNYYGEAGPYMEQMYEEMIAWTNYVEQTYMPSPGYLYEDIDAKEEYWPMQLLEHFLDLVDKSYEAIAPLQGSNPKLYKVLHDHINIESMFPRYVLSDLYYYLFSEADLLELRLNFKSDCQLLGIQEYKEVHTGYAVGDQGWMSEKFDEWGIK